jgi:transposase
MSKTRMSDASAFPTRLTDEQWAIFEPLVPANKPGEGRPPKYQRRDIVDAIV